MIIHEEPNEERTDCPTPKGSYIQIRLDIKVEREKARFRRINRMMKKAGIVSN